MQCFIAPHGVLSLKKWTAAFTIFTLPTELLFSDSTLHVVHMTTTSGHWQNADMWISMFRDAKFIV